jgi:hypothetical protein
MSNENELVKIEEQTALVAFSKDGGLLPFIDQVRDEVLNFEHDLSNGARRNKTASLAMKVRKMKTRLDSLGKSLTDDWAKQKKAVDTNRKTMRDEMDEIAKLARKPLDEWEAEQAEIEANKLFLALWGDAINENLDYDSKKAADLLMQHLEAINENHLFDAAAKESARLAKAAEEQAEKDRIQHDKEVAEKAVLDAKVAFDLKIKQAEQEKEAAQRRIKSQEADAIQALINAQAAERRARDDENARHEAEKQSILDEEEDRRKNIAHGTKIRTEMKISLMENAGLSEKDAINTVKAITKELIKHTKVSY